MRVKLTIEDGKVEDVGYRAFLLSLATAYNLRGFLASNIGEGVVVLAEGDERDVEEFVRAVKAKRPRYAEVSRIGVERYEGPVTPIEKYSRALMAEQLSKILQAGLEMVKKQGEGLDIAKETLGVAKETKDITRENLKVSKETRELVRSARDGIRELRNDFRSWLSKQVEELRGRSGRAQEGRSEDGEQAGQIASFFMPGPL